MEHVEDIEEIKEKLKKDVETAKNVVLACDAAVKVVKTGMVIGTFFLVNKAISDLYKPTGLYKLGKWGIAYAAAAEVANVLNEKGVNNGGTED